jgi:hypothetical protein
MGVSSESVHKRLSCITSTYKSAAWWCQVFSSQFQRGFRQPNSGPVPPLPRDPLRPTQPTPSRGRGRGWGNIKLSFGRWHANGFAIGRASPLSRETRSAQHSRHRRGGGAGGGGTWCCRPGDDMRTSSPLATRPLIRPSGTFPRRGKDPLKVDSVRRRICSLRAPSAVAGKSPEGAFYPSPG